MKAVPCRLSCTAVHRNTNALSGCLGFMSSIIHARDSSSWLGWPCLEASPLHITFVPRLSLERHCPRCQLDGDCCTEGLPAAETLAFAVSSPADSSRNNFEMLLGISRGQLSSSPRLPWEEQEEQEAAQKEKQESQEQEQHRRQKLLRRQVAILVRSVSGSSSWRLAKWQGKGSPESSDIDVATLEWQTSLHQTTNHLFKEGAAVSSNTELFAVLLMKPSKSCCHDTVCASAASNDELLCKPRLSARGSAQPAKTDHLPCMLH